MRFGIDPFVTTAEVKDYIGISSNTFDDQINVYISTTCTVFEHYIGYPLKANTYTDEFQIDNISTYPDVKNVQDVYEVQIDGVVLDDPKNTGAAIKATTTEEFKIEGNATIDSRKSKFGTSSLKLPNSTSYISLEDVPENLQLKDNDFTIEMWVYTTSFGNSTLFEISEDENNYFSITTTSTRLTATAKKGSDNPSVSGTIPLNAEGNAPTKSWNHIAFVRDYENDKGYLFWNGTKINTSSDNFAIDNLDFSNIINIGKGFVGSIDEVRVSSTARYGSTDATRPTIRSLVDNDTLLLLHFDNGVKNAATTTSQYFVDKEVDAITLCDSVYNTNKGNTIRVNYRAGYDEVPEDIKGAAVSYIELWHKKELDAVQLRSQHDMITKHGLYQSNPSNFPPHIQRILDLYRE